MDFSVITPTTKTELFSAIRKTKNFRYGAGFTDILNELKKANSVDLTIINLARIQLKEFNSIDKATGGIRIGALVTAAKITDDKTIQKKYPVLYEAALSLASSQIREVATIGGNICTASPSGDIACSLIALNAKCRILSAKGTSRTVLLSAFFLGPRKTVLKKDEILASIFIPDNLSGTELCSGFIKIGIRQSMECSVVSLAYHFERSKKGIIKQAGIAIGAVAPTIKFTTNACDFILGKNLNSLSLEEIDKFAEIVVSYASPISDVRANAWYRKEVLYNISRSILENLCSQK